MTSAHYKRSAPRRSRRDGRVLLLVLPKLAADRQSVVLADSSGWRLLLRRARQSAHRRLYLPTRTIGPELRCYPPSSSMPLTRRDSLRPPGTNAGMRVALRAPQLERLAA